MTQENSQNQNNAAITLGNELRHQREKCNLSIGEVAERLKLPARQVEALEKGDYESLPEPVFVRGFLRSYGRFLDIDEEILDNALANISPPAAVRNTSKTVGSLNFSNEQRKKPFPTWIFGVLAIGTIGYGVYAWQNKSQTENAKQEATSTAKISVASEASVPNVPNSTNVIVKPMTASDTQTVTASADSIASSPAQAIMQGAAPVPGELVITARYRTMLTVTNNKGEVLINQIVPGHSEHRFKDGAPFEVRLGYASGSTATFGGQPIDVEAARKGSKTATFTAQ
ncbi:helix-turn-helix domain-containing protein [Kingella negevensis]|uniref:Cytoskeleton protein RodZ n=1 Tax=Kingella negevensis TaxID=1522312 RepID=A0A238TAD2_9NEIS|nr:helix-turn-helix domain-containing protein [Kingella negevensis]MDK4683668.1 DUF4115 domain-containing protein [Kingella negevensis]MDK4687760.1 DUF4115 domain-containing protein [Kingella negevensis]MDK4697701.1 DUF4115 domain-containing protein [Kingella negevensis]MDK4708437.1 DUF4115 domain-containing protein [Kingella negevensis]MDK4710902.1 DUF4115 domain-containing protein [Kingella negevensis]